MCILNLCFFQNLSLISTELFAYCFLPFYPPLLPPPHPSPPHNTPQIENFEKMKKVFGYVIILHMCTKNHDHMMYASWNMDATGIIFCHFGPFFALLPQHWPWKLKFEKTLPFDPPNNPKNQNFGKMKKMLEDIIILHLCITNDNHMMYSSWDMECDRIFVTLGHLSFYHNNNLKNQNFEKMKETMEITSFYTCVPQMTIIWCMVSEKWSGTEFFLVLDYFLPFYPPNNLENQNFEKIK